MRFCEMRPSTRTLEHTSKHQPHPLSHDTSRKFLPNSVVSSQSTSTCVFGFSMDYREKEPGPREHPAYRAIQPKAYARSSHSGLQIWRHHPPLCSRANNQLFVDSRRNEAEEAEAVIPAQNVDYPTEAELNHEARHPVSYVAFIDEAGDDGVRKVAPIDIGGASEWFVVAGVIIRVERLKELSKELEELKIGLGIRRSDSIHFRKLNEEEQAIACATVGRMPVRWFAILSNKQNIRGYRNDRAAKVSKKQWFYSWMIRLLLERVTCFAKADCVARHSGRRSLSRGIFSTRDVFILSVQSYLRLLRMRSEGNNLYLDLGDLAWEMIDFGQMTSRRHKQSAGLQVADIVASSLYKSIREPSASRSPSLRLRPNVGRTRGRSALGTGIKVMPSLAAAPAKLRAAHLASRNDRRPTKVKASSHRSITKLRLVSPNL